MATASQPFHYYHFDTLSERRDIFNFSKGLAEYLFKNKIKNIAFVDRSARSAWVGLYTYWNMHMKKERPDIYFFCPDGFDQRRAKQKFKEKFSRLYKKRKQTIVIYDTCGHSGDTVRKITDLLGGELEFSDIRIITANSPDRGCSFSVDYVINSHINYQTCYPFGRSGSIVKTSGVCCVRNDSCNRGREISIRREIQQIVKSGWA